MEKFAGGIARETDCAPVQRGKEGERRKACQPRKTLTAEPGTPWRPERVDARQSRAQDAFDYVTTPRHSWPATRPPPAAGHVGLAEIAYQRDELDLALRHATEGIALCRQFVYTTPLASGLATLAMIRQATGDSVGALEAITEAERASPGPAGLLNPVPVRRARLLLAQGDLAAAARFPPENGLGPDDEPDYAASLRTWSWLAPGSARSGPRTSGPAVCRGESPAAGRQPRRGGRPG